MKRLLVSSTISGPIKPILQRHDERLRQLFEALQARDSGEAAARADELSELWQALRQLAVARMRPPYWSRLRASIAGKRERYDQLDESERLHLDLLMVGAAWIQKVADRDWIREIDHVCKQMEEYAEEIRDGARESDLGFSYIEHCIPGFLTYCQSIKRLPWDHPAEPMETRLMLEAIRRDLEIARRETLHPDNRDADRFIDRSVEHAQRMASVVRRRYADDKDRRGTASALAEAIDILEETASKAKRRAYELEPPGGIQGSGFRLALQERPDGTATVAELLIQQIVKALDLDETLAKRTRSGRPGP